MTTSQRISDYVLPTYGRAPISLVKGQGTWVWDEEGRRYLDFCMGIAVCCLGHCHPKVTAAIQKQAETLVHCSNLYQIPQQAELAELLVTQCVQRPGKVFFSNSGAEANDGLIKMARRFGHARPAEDGSVRYEILTFHQSFHGRTLGSMAATGQDKIKIGFDPMLPGFRHLPLNDLETVRGAIAKETVAILLEPLQGEGGVNPATPEFLRGLAELCREHDLLLLIDEVQAGFGRCGELMGWRAIAPEVDPDGVSWAKALGGGVPIGGFFVSDRPIDESGTHLSSLMGPGSHGSTYGGNPLVCASALAVLNELLEKDLTKWAKETGEKIKREVMSWNLPVVETVRGYGLLLGIILKDGVINVPEGKMLSSYVVDLIREKGMLTVPAGPAAIRLLPPLNVSEEEVAEGLSILKDVLSRFV